MQVARTRFRHNPDPLIFLSRSDFYQEKRDNFLFIALELCSASLADIVENPSAHQDLAVGFDRKKSIYQITSGLKHLHSLKIIHRDLKPQ